MNTGGPAFPTPEIEVELHDDNGNVIGCRVFPPSQGMTLLDWYAGQLLTGYVAHNGVSGNFDQHAKDCYDLASAMLAEKARREAVVQQSSTTDHSPDATKMIELQAANRAANQEVERLRTELYKFADSHAKLTIANRELVEALEGCNSAFGKLDPIGGSDCAFAWASVQAILAKHKVAK